MTSQAEELRQKAHEAARRLRDMPNIMQGTRNPRPCQLPQYSRGPNTRVKMRLRYVRHA